MAGAWRPAPGAFTPDPPLGRVHRSLREPTATTRSDPSPFGEWALYRKSRLEYTLRCLRGYRSRSSTQPPDSRISTETRASPRKSGLACGSRGVKLSTTSAPSTTSPKIV
jgi:hypothetical protein